MKKISVFWQLFSAARAELLKHKIIPALNSGKTVICDRYIDSSFAYQAYARGLGLDFVKKINAYAIENAMPDITVFLDISPEEAFARKGGADSDRMEQSGAAFHQAVYGGFKKLAADNIDRIKT